MELIAESVARARPTRLLRLAPFFALPAVVLVPWSVYLEQTLPSQHQAQHWDVTWIGFDAALAAALAAVAVSAARRSAWLEGAASTAATLLFVDAWFDVLTAKTMAEVTSAALEAAAVELPLGMLCVLIARAAKRRLQPTVELEHAASDAFSSVHSDLMAMGHPHRHDHVVLEASTGWVGSSQPAARPAPLLGRRSSPC